MSYLLLTGATGLLGEYLLRDLTRRGRPMVVVARGRGKQSAAQRLERVLARLERAEGHALRRPIVLEGDLGEPRLGLDDEAVRWVGRHCDTVLHNAASLQFQADPPLREDRQPRPDREAGEPYRSNVGGTRHLLDLCEAAGLRRLHHVSTAYVCGGQRGRISESAPLDPEAAGNDYEASKIESERLVREHAAIDELTVYRPAIIVGDHGTGYSSTFHGFYVPLQVCHGICAASPGNQGLPADQLLRALGLTGEERKNFVPVDWVSQIIARGVSAGPGEYAGRTLHLAPRERVTVAQMTDAIVDALSNLPPTASRAAASGAAADPGRLLAMFQEHMKVYRAYWSDDPEFDTATTGELAPDTPCPAIDHAAMLRLCRYAIQSNFGARKEPPRPHEPTLRERSDAPLESSFEQSGADGRVIGCCVTGPGGGDFALRLGSVGGSADVAVGVPPRIDAEIRLHRATLDALADGSLGIHAAVARGLVVGFGGALLERPELLTRAAEAVAQFARGAGVGATP